MPPPRPRANRRSLRRSGLTLVEVTLVISVVGVLLAVFIPTFVRELRTSKISEAATQLEALHRAAQRISEIVKKMWEAREYTTKPYVRGIQILDFDAAASSPPAADDPETHTR